MRIVLDVWQFVRLMVRLERTRERDPARRALWAAWAADWQRLDRELDRLRAEDFAGFADAMMAQQLVFEPVDAATVRMAARLAREVAGELGRAGQGAGPDTGQGAGPDASRALAFEREGLTELARRLEALARRG